MSDNLMMGRGQVIGLGLETTPGTAVSATIWLPLISVTPQTRREQVASPELYVGTGGVPSRYASMRRTHRLSFELLVGYQGLGLLLRAALGATATTGAGPYDHSFTLSDTPPALTCYVPRGNPTATLTRRSDVFAGLQITKLVIVGAAGEFFRVQVEGMAMSNTPQNTSIGSVTAPDFAECHQGSTLGWNSSTYDLRRFELTINRPFAERFNIGSLNTDRMHIEDRTEITMRVVLDLTGEDFITAHDAVTESDATFTLTGSGNLAFAVTLHSAAVRTAPDNPISDFGRVEQTVEFMPRNVLGGTDYGLELVVSNDEASYAS